MQAGRQVCTSERACAGLASPRVPVDPPLDCRVRMLVGEWLAVVTIKLRIDDQHRRRPIPLGSARLGHGTVRLTARRGFRGEGEMSAWFGGSATVIVVYLDTRTGEAVEVDRVIPRDS
jgi:hypothetical protein